MKQHTTVCFSLRTHAVSEDAIKDCPLVAILLPEVLPEIFAFLDAYSPKSECKTLRVGTLTSRALSVTRPIRIARGS